jgi:hypothetical protein
MTDFQQQERREINEGIEVTYRELSAITAGIRTHFQVGRGVIFDLFEKMHFYTAVLVELTESLEQMEQSQDIIRRLNEWLDLPPVSDRDIKDRCAIGLKLIKEYKTALIRSGLITLPSKGK